MIRLDAATVLLQWAAGGLLFLWVTTRRRQLGIGYGWLLRGIYLVLAAGAVAAGRAGGSIPGRDVCAALTCLAVIGALTASVQRRKAGVAGQHMRRERVAARLPGEVGKITHTQRGQSSQPREFPPALDAISPFTAFLGLVFAAHAAGGPFVLATVRTLVGAAFLGAVTDAMLLGHWYLVQPGLGRAPLHELVRWVQWLWPLEIAALLWPDGMVQVLTGSIDDGWHGTLGWFWVACAVTTLVLTGVTRAALRERAYSAVMAATGLLYLAILTAAGTDLVARAILAG